MSSQKLKLAIGFITYGDSTAKYLPYFLPSLIETVSKLQNVQILAIDNSEAEENENRKIIKKNSPQIDLEWAGENLGFAKGYNRLIKKAVSLGAEYFLMLNPDMILEPDAIARLVKAMDDDKELGSACPKILRWDFKNNKKTKIIDTCGIVLRPGLKFVDLGQGEEDSNDFDPSAGLGQVKAKILGPSGAAGIFRIKALQDMQTKFLSREVRAGEDAERSEAGGGKDNQYFDERFFMYKEDCDLAYRLFLAGWRSKLVNDAIIYHDRTGSGAGESNLGVALNRKSKSRQVKIWSFWGQYIIFLKYWRLQSFWDKVRVLGQALKMFAFVILFEQYLLKQYQELWKARGEIKNN